MMNYQEVVHWSYHHAWIVVIGVSSVKISVGCFLLRLVQGKWYKVGSSSHDFLPTSNASPALYHRMDCLPARLHPRLYLYIVSCPLSKLVCGNCITGPDPISLEYSNASRLKQLGTLS